MELKTAADWYKIRKYEIAKKKHRDTLSVLMYNTIPALDELTTFVCSEHIPESLRKGLYTQINKVLRDLKNHVIESV